MKSNYRFETEKSYDVSNWRYYNMYGGSTPKKKHWIDVPSIVVSELLKDNDINHQTAFSLLNTNDYDDSALIWGMIGEDKIIYAVQAHRLKEEGLFWLPEEDLPLNPPIEYYAEAERYKQEKINKVYNKKEYKKPLDFYKKCRILIADISSYMKKCQPKATVVS